MFPQVILVLSPNNREFITKCPKVRIGSHTLRIISGIKKNEKIKKNFFEKSMDLSAQNIGNFKGIYYDMIFLCNGYNTTYYKNRPKTEIEI